MNVKISKQYLLLFVLSLFSLAACKNKKASKITEDEKKEVIELEESAEKIDNAVEELDSAIKQLDELEDLLK